jgi:hypothetical protein
VGIVNNKDEWPSIADAPDHLAERGEGSAPRLSGITGVVTSGLNIESARGTPEDGK